MAEIGPSPTLAEACDAFLSQLPAEEAAQARGEVSRFVRWLGPSRRVTDVSPVDVASYGENIVPSAVKPLRSFLTYIWKKGLSNMNLAPHLRARKTVSKAAASRTVVPRQADRSRATLTAEGYAKLEQELVGLKEQRLRVVEEMQIAAVDKDFRENAPLAAARERKAHLDGRIKEIESVLKEARIMGQEQATSRAKLGDTVVLQDLSSGKDLTYTLVDPREANPTQGRLSVASPLGKAVLDKEKGQVAEVAAPAGTLRCRVESIIRAER
ncbi:MAG: GreA/GreB family elongation factor [Dehalococcoidia bacterium]